MYYYLGAFGGQMTCFLVLRRCRSPVEYPSCESRGLKNICRRRSHVVNNAVMMQLTRILALQVLA